MQRSSVCVLATDGTNCDEETRFAFELAGGSAEIVHVNELRSRRKRLSDYGMLVIPGGFSYGDDIASGKVLAIELTAFFKDELSAFVERGGFVLGICNGFQVLVRTGLLPGRQLGTMQATLTHNAVGSFVCRWVELLPTLKSPCILTQGIGHPIYLQSAHGEGRWKAFAEVIDAVEAAEQVPFRYGKDGQVTAHFPHNPNGSTNSIAAVCDYDGRVMGMMPHPERFVRQTDYINWRRLRIEKPHGLMIFENAVQALRS